VPIVLKSVSLNLLEPSGPVQGCNGIALPLLLPLLSISGDGVAKHRWSAFAMEAGRFLRDGISVF
jgi:hypothetical protein